MLMLMSIWRFGHVKPDELLGSPEVDNQQLSPRKNIKVFGKVQRLTLEQFEQ
jgi:hypothetical protein